MLSREVVEIVCFVLAQSAAMEYYERDVDQIFAGLRKASTTIAEHGTFRGNEKDLLRFVGNAMITRNEIISTLALLDTPQLAWNAEPLDKLFRALRDLFEIEDRYRALTSSRWCRTTSRSSSTSRSKGGASTSSSPSSR